MLIDNIKAAIITATKKRESLKKSILKMLVSESSKKTDGKAPSDDEVIAAAKALIKSNNIILVTGSDEILEQENEILSAYLPASNLSQEEFDNIFKEFENENLINSDKVAEYRGGNEKLFGFLMGKLVSRFDKNVEKSDIKDMIQKEFNKE